MALLQELGLVRIESEDGDDIFTTRGLSSEQIGKIIAAAELPLVGGQTTFKSEQWKVPHLTLTSELTRNDPMREANRIDTSWWCSLDGYVGKFNCDEWNQIHFHTRCTYRFSADGSLVRTSSRDMITLAYVERDVAIPIRQQSDQGAITPEVAIAAMAALLYEFRELYPSLSRTTNAGLSRQLIEVERVARRLAGLLDASELKVLREIGSEAFALANKNLAKQIRSLRLLANKYPKKKNARMLAIGPLQTCFRLLFGLPATSHRKLVGTIPSYRADGPFIRFAHAFFSQMGCGCAMDTIHCALCDWRHPRAKVHRTNKRKKIETSS